MRRSRRRISADRRHRRQLYAPSLIPALIAELRAASDKPIVVYPNSGEGWDAQARCWTGNSDPAAYGIKAAEWLPPARRSSAAVAAPAPPTSAKWPTPRHIFCH